jgi:hypothetical protein
MGWVGLVSAIALGIGLTAKPVISANGANGIDPEADKVLKSMSSYLAQTKAFSVNADIDFEFVNKDEQKVQLSSFGTIVLQRPDKFYIHRRGMLADAEFIFDGKNLTLYGKRKNNYAQLNASGSIDDAIRVFERETGFPAPGADLLFADPYAILSNGVKSSNYLGTTYVNGIECHHLAFREDEVDWQLWVQVGNQPLPLKYVITSKKQIASPQYEIRLRDWNTNPQIAANQFTFSAPAGATRLPAPPTNELDEFPSTQEKQQ